MWDQQNDMKLRNQKNSVVQRGKTIFWRGKTIFWCGPGVVRAWSTVVPPTHPSHIVVSSLMIQFCSRWSFEMWWCSFLALRLKWRKPYTSCCCNGFQQHRGGSYPNRPSPRDGTSWSCSCAWSCQATTAKSRWCATKSFSERTVRGLGVGKL